MNRICVIFDFKDIDQFVAAKYISRGSTSNVTDFVDINDLLYEDGYLCSEKLTPEFMDEHVVGTFDTHIICGDNIFTYDQHNEVVLNYFLNAISAEKACPHVIVCYNTKWLTKVEPYLHTRNDIDFGNTSFTYLLWDLSIYKTKRSRIVPAAVRTIETMRKFNTMVEPIIAPEYFEAYNLLLEYKKCIMRRYNDETWPEEFIKLLDYNIFETVDIREFIRKLKYQIEQFDVYCKAANFDKFIRGNREYE